MLVIMKDDPLLLKIRKALKNFKEEVMKDAHQKVEKWENKNKKEVKMGEIIQNTEIKRESGWLYYCGTNKDTGYLTICKAKMRQGRKKKEESE